MKYSFSLVIILILSVFLYQSNASVNLKVGYCGIEQCWCGAKYFEDYGKDTDTNYNSYTIPNYPEKIQVWTIDMSYNETGRELLLDGTFTESDSIPYPINDQDNSYDNPDCTYASFHKFNDGSCTILVICNDAISSFTFSYFLIAVSILISLL
ncbi:hypothetical protein ACTA71_006871 [Dictyostelium dimigraforme]